MTRPLPAVEPPQPRLASTRSRVSNGGLPGGVHPQSSDARRFVDVVLDLTAELGGSLTAAETLQVRTVAGLVVHAEQLQAAVLRGETIDTEQFIRVSNSAARLISVLKRGRASRAKAAKGSALREFLAAREGGAV